MTFLQLVQELHREAGCSGSAPSTVVGATGEAARLKNWIINEWEKIQLRHPNWRWMRGSFTLSTSASDDTYAYGDCTDSVTSSAITRFSRWYPDDFKIYLTSAGVGTEGWLTYQEWDAFKRVYRIGTQNEGYPAIVTVDPSENIVLGPVPNAAYTVSGDYQKSVQTLGAANPGSADTEEPEMPAQFHDLIWLGAMRRYASYESAPEVWAEAKSQHGELMRALESSQLPHPNFANPLA